MTDSLRLYLAKINIVFFVTFLVIGFISYNYNGFYIGDIINHFSTFFGGSSLILVFIYCFTYQTFDKKLQVKVDGIFSKYKWLSWIDKKFTKIDKPHTYSREYAIGAISLLGTLSFIVYWEIIHQPKLRTPEYIQWHEVLSGIIGWITFVLINFLIFKHKKNLDFN